jgi:hypothetical protein
MPEEQTMMNCPMSNHDSYSFHMRKLFSAWVIAGLLVAGCQQRRDLTIGSWVEVSMQDQTAIGLLVDYGDRITAQQSGLHYLIDFGENKEGRDRRWIPEKFTRRTKATTTFLNVYLEPNLYLHYKINPGENKGRWETVNGIPYER